MPIIGHRVVGSIAERRVVVEELAAAVAAEVIQHVPSGCLHRAGPTSGDVGLGQMQAPTRKVLLKRFDCLLHARLRHRRAAMDDGAHGGSERYRTLTIVAGPGHAGQAPRRPSAGNKRRSGEGVVRRR